MKKLIFSLIALAGFVFPLAGQVAGESIQDETVPTETLTLRHKQIPPAIVNEVRSDLISDKAFMWRKLPTIQDRYPWIITGDAKSNPPSYYEASLKIRNGDIFVKYFPDGTVIQSEVIRRNAALPYKVAEDLQSGQYKGWKVIGDKEFIRYLSSRNSVEERFKIEIEKGNIKKSVTLNYNEPV